MDADSANQQRTLREMPSRTRGSASKERVPTAATPPATPKSTGYWLLSTARSQARTARAKGRQGQTPARRNQRRALRDVPAQTRGSASLPASVRYHSSSRHPPSRCGPSGVLPVLARATYFVSAVGGGGSEGWSLRSFFSSFLAFFSFSLFRFSNW
jgi:hypothetical protein